MPAVEFPNVIAGFAAFSGSQAVPQAFGTPGINVVRTGVGEFEVVIEDAAFLSGRTVYVASLVAPDPTGGNVGWILNVSPNALQDDKLDVKIFDGSGAPANADFSILALNRR